MAAPVMGDNPVALTEKIEQRVSQSSALSGHPRWKTIGWALFGPQSLAVSAVFGGDRSHGITSSFC
jgi:hypothetical protein